ncbi:hypothetical protein CRE_08997 [Caenorhabditis remanei]|uniref:NR LBD domain-containing protein n=1 Tax=Caenorhabditis remanei TaxID=31234 RepID=E3LIN9_CAERE|nr:hypothetical protein CRE_08997 [Caenorhabditis remanei]
MHCALALKKKALVHKRTEKIGSLTIPDISDEARLILSRHQSIYSNALFQYCELTNQQNAPTRMTDLIWLYEYITKNSQEMETLFMIFHCNAPHFKFRKLIRDTFHF